MGDPDYNQPTLMAFLPDIMAFTRHVFQYMITAHIIRKDSLWYASNHKSVFYFILLSWTYCNFKY